MKNAIDLTPGAIASIKALAQKATPEFVREGHFIYGPKHPASKHPNGRILIANIIEGSNQRDPNLDGGVGIGSGKDDAAFIAAAHPGAILAMCEEIEGLRAEAGRLEKEADWLAEALSHHECPSEIGFETDTEADKHCADKKSCNSAACWREAARKAVEKEIDNESNE